MSAKAARPRPRAPPIAATAGPDPASRLFRSTSNKITAMVLDAQGRLDRLESERALLPEESKPVRASLDRLLASAQRRLALEERRANSDAWRKRYERKVVAALGRIRDYCAITVEDVAARSLGIDRDQMTHAQLTEIGKILTRAGWVQTRPRGPGSTRKRVYIGPPMRLFAEAHGGK